MKMLQVLPVGFRVYDARFAAAILLGPLLVAAPLARGAAIGLTISPAAVTNDYVGKITLNITNLTPGMTVNVQEYADLNANGVIDAGDLLIKSLQLTDGQAPKVGGVRNLNVPGDEDGLTNGQIQGVLYFPGASAVIASGQALLRVSDPAGALNSATQAFSVAQRVLPEKITGRLTTAGTGLPLSNVPVGLLALAGTKANLTFTDTNGNYSIYCLPGVYALEGVNQNGAVFNELGVLLTCGETLTNNEVITNGTFSITGRVTDGTTGLGIAGLEMDARPSNNLLPLSVLTFTDINGNYTFRVTTNTWSVHPGTGAASEAGYVDPTRFDVAITNASVSNVNFALAPVSALIYGTIKDTLNNPVMDVQISARDQFNSFHLEGRSFASNANYCVGVQAGTWGPTPDVNDLGLKGFIGSGTNVTLVTGQATNLNFVVTRTNWPSLQSPLRLSNTQFQFLLSGLAGQNYTIQSATNLGADDWQVVLETNPPCGTALILDPHATNNSRFYRAVVGP
jgi:hypothetical protein